MMIVREFRERHKLSQEALAEAMGCAQPTIARLEKVGFGNSVKKARAFKRVAHEHGETSITLDVIFDGQDDR